MDEQSGAPAGRRLDFQRSADKRHTFAHAENAKPVGWRPGWRLIVPAEAATVVLDDHRQLFVRNAEDNPDPLCLGMARHIRQSLPKHPV